MLYVFFFPDTRECLSGSLFLNMTDVLDNVRYYKKFLNAQIGTKTSFKPRSSSASKCFSGSCSAHPNLRPVSCAGLPQASLTPLRRKTADHTLKPAAANSQICDAALWPAPFAPCANSRPPATPLNPGDEKRGEEVANFLKGTNCLSYRLLLEAPVTPWNNRSGLVLGRLRSEELMVNSPVSY